MTQRSNGATTCGIDAKRVAYMMLSRETAQRAPAIRAEKPTRRVMIQAAFILSMQGHTQAARELWNLQQAMYPTRAGRPRVLSGTSRVYRAFRVDKSDVTDNAYVRIPVVSLGVRWGEDVTAVFSRGSITILAGREPMFVPDAAGTDGVSAAEVEAALDRPDLDPTVRARMQVETDKHRAAQEARMAGAAKGRAVPRSDSVFDPGYRAP